MGRPIAMTHLDRQGDNARYQEFARRLLDKDKVDVLIGGKTSASREAIRPIIDKHTRPISTPTSMRAACATRSNDQPARSRSSSSRP